MKVGSLVKTSCGRLGIIESIDDFFDMGRGNYPYNVYMLDDNWRIEYFKGEHLELVNESR